MSNPRSDHIGPQRTVYLKNKKRIFATQNVCALCGREVDFSLKYPHPLSASIDHIIPISRGGHPSDIENMQLAHWTCNRQKSNMLQKENKTPEELGEVISNRNLPWSINWLEYRGDKGAGGTKTELKNQTE